MSEPKRSIVWFRRDLRITDHPALLEAIASSDEIVPVFILDKNLIGQSGSKRLAYLGQSLRALDDSLGNSLHVMVFEWRKIGLCVDVFGVVCSPFSLDRSLIR